jgi:hypothetical protein
MICTVCWILCDCRHSEAWNKVQCLSGYIREDEMSWACCVCG